MSAGSVRVDRVVIPGVFSLDGQDFDVENNVWLIGDDREVLVVDAPHDADPIIAAIGDRDVVGLVCTHGHNDHINAAGELRQATGVPIWLHPGDNMLWSAIYADVLPDHELADGDLLAVAGVGLEALSTPGHSPGSVCLHAPDLGTVGTVFTGDTLFAGGPGATGRSYSDLPTIIASIRTRLLTLPEETTVHTGHGQSTTIGAEVPHLQKWIAGDR